MNKTLYMTYKKPVPTFVFERWRKLNPSYTIEFSLDEDCISFLRTHFNEYIVTLFKNIPVGMFKADLWRLCKLYVYGGSYADVDLIPHISLETLNKDITFYTCLSAHEKSIFQAFMIQNIPRSPLLLCFLLSFLHNRPYTKPNGPTYDMYRCLAYNVQKNEKMN